MFRALICCLVLLLVGCGSRTSRRAKTQDAAQAPAVADSGPSAAGTTGAGERDRLAPPQDVSEPDPGPAAADGPDVVETPDVAVAQDAGPAEPDVPSEPCLELPEPSGDGVVFTRAPYLQWPTMDSITVMFETTSYTAGQVAVWLEGDECMTAIVETEPAMMPTLIEGETLPKPAGPQHAAWVKGLEPGTRYHYRVIVGGTASATRTFWTAPTKSQDFVIAVQGDNRTHDLPHQAVVDAMTLHAPRLVVHTGDSMATGGSLDDWDGFFAIESELLSKAPMLPAYGNHEEMAGGEVYYRGYWTVRESKYDAELSYAFAYGRSYWIFLNTNEWIENDIDFAKQHLQIGDEYDFLFVVFHAPMYSFSKHTPNSYWQNLLVPQLEKYAVSAVFNGHNHCYEHFLIDGVHYVVTGGGGAPLYDPDAHIVPGLESTRLASRKAHHFTIAEFTGDTATFTVHDVDAENVIDVIELQSRN